MIKRIAASASVWSGVLCCLTFLTIVTSNPWAMSSCVLWIMTPIVTWALNLFVKNKISIKITIPPTMNKHQIVQGTVTVINHSWIPIGRMYCKLQLQNNLTKEMEKEILHFSAPAKSQQESKFEISSKYCGYLEVTVSKLYLMDWIGFLPVTCKLAGKGTSAVMPDTFCPVVSLSISTAKREDADTWSAIEKGKDQTEVFALRDYVEGDPIKQIHWKVSSKRQQLVVKEPSMPVEKSLLIFWDKTTGNAEPKEMDALAECVASLAQEIYAQGTLFTLGWTEGTEVAFEAIAWEEDLLQAIPRMIKKGANEKELLNWKELSQERTFQEYGKVIYIGKTISKELEEAFNGDISYVICGGESSHPIWPVVQFQASSYFTDLEIVEL